MRNDALGGGGGDSRLGFGIQNSNLAVMRWFACVGRQILNTKLSNFKFKVGRKAFMTHVRIIDSSIGR